MDYHPSVKTVCVNDQSFLRGPMSGNCDVYVYHADRCHDITRVTDVLWYVDDSHTSWTVRVRVT